MQTELPFGKFLFPAESSCAAKTMVLPNLFIFSQVGTNDFILILATFTSLTFDPLSCNDGLVCYTCLGW